MAPEQSTGEPQTTASDLYSAGVMLYEALAGRPPFAGSFVDVISMKCRMTPRAPSACALGVPADLGRAVHGAPSTAIPPRRPDGHGDPAPASA